MQDLLDLSKGATPDGTTPFVLSILSPQYTEAYELIPEGSLMREYLDIKARKLLGEGMGIDQGAAGRAVSRAGPKLDAGDEFKLRQMLTNTEDAEWLLQRLQSLDADAARQYESTKDLTERLDISRKLVEVDGTVSLETNAMSTPPLPSSGGASGASGSSATTYSSFINLLDNYTGDVKSRMESDEEGGVQATTMYDEVEELMPAVVRQDLWSGPLWPEPWP